eukprot:gene16483-22648_t
MVVFFKTANMVCACTWCAVFFQTAHRVVGLCDVRFEPHKPTNHKPIDRPHTGLVASRLA